MKIILTLLSALSLLSIQAQTYHPINDSNVVWREESSALSMGCSCGSGSTYVEKNDFQYFLGKDTIIGPYIYKKLLKTGSQHGEIFGPCNYTSNCGGSSSYVYWNNFYVGGVRQDIQSKRVYFMPADNYVDTLLYDFNLKIGDTLPESYINYENTNYVSSIDSVLIGTNYHNRFHISVIQGQQDYTTIIEGIGGGTFGLLTLLSPPFEINCELKCVTFDAVTVYPDKNTTCELATKIDEIDNSFNFSISPNPFQSFTSIILESTFNSGEYKIYNVLGEMVQQDKISSNSFIVNRKNLNTGLYFIQISDDKGKMQQSQLIAD